jgi:hypothetical protein
VSTVITPPLTSFVVPYPDFASRLANAIVYANSSEYPAASSLKIEQRYDSDNNTFVPSVSTILIYPQMTLLTKSIDTTNATSFGDTGSIDAFGRLRVSSLESLLDSKHTLDNLPLVYDQVLGGTTSSNWVSGNACVVLTTSAANDYGIRQTFQSFNYQPGKSQLVLCTGVFSTETNITKRAGLFRSSTVEPFSALEGFYFENASGAISFNIANPNGTVGSQIAERSIWNVDKLDGTGPSGVILDLTKTQIIVLDFEWLGVGRVRMGFVIDGKIFYCHYFNNANNKINTYLRSPNLPIRYEIRQTGTGTGRLTQICSTVNSENATTRLGQLASVNTGSNTTTFNKNVNSILIATRLNTNYPAGASLGIDGVSVLTDSNVNIKYELVLNPTFSSALTYTNLSSTPLQYALGNGTTTASGGYVLYSSFVNQRADAPITIPAEKLRYGVKIDGTPDVIALNVYIFGANNQIVYGGINFTLAS